MITKFSPEDEVKSKIQVSEGNYYTAEGIIKLIAINKDSIQYEIELNQPVNGNAFLWFHEDELALIRRNYRPGGNIA